MLVTGLRKLKVSIYKTIILWVMIVTQVDLVLIFTQSFVRWVGGQGFTGPILPVGLDRNKGSPSADGWHRQEWSDWSMGLTWLFRPVLLYLFVRSAPVECHTQSSSSSSSHSSLSSSSSSSSSHGRSKVTSPIWCWTADSWGWLLQSERFRMAAVVSATTLLELPGKGGKHLITKSGHSNLHS